MASMSSISVKVSPSEVRKSPEEVSIKRIHVIRVMRKGENSPPNLTELVDALFQAISEQLKSSKHPNYQFQKNIIKANDHFDFMFFLLPSANLEDLVPRVEALVKEKGMNCLTREEAQAIKNEKMSKN